MFLYTPLYKGFPAQQFLNFFPLRMDMDHSFQVLLVYNLVFLIPYPVHHICRRTFVS